MCKRKSTNLDVPEASSQSSLPDQGSSIPANKELGREILMKPSNSAPPRIIMPAGSDGSSGVVLQKKRRVVRACDRCRKLKIKCSGDLPCIHCTVYSYECTYDQPSRAKRKNTTANAGSPSGPSANSQHPHLPTNSLEVMARMADRLKLYDDILHRLLPDIKLTDLNDNPKPINPMKLLTAMNKLREKSCDETKSSSKTIAEEYERLPDVPLPTLPSVPKPAPSTTAVKTHESPSERSHFCSPHGGGPHQGIDGSYESSMGKEIKIILPSREVALRLITKTWENACVLFRFYHRPAFIEDLNELYDTDPSQYTNKQQRFLPLVYSVMACGALFLKSDEQTNGSKNGEPTPENEVFEDEGYRYFIAARKLIDITDTRDTYGIQTIVMLIIFLQCSARLSTCYAYIGIALRAALREGLHRKLDYPFNPIELEIRKRLFWTIYKMDIYVNTMLGLPRTISEDDFDQDMPIELDDENITVDGYRFEKQGDRLSSSGIANAHTRLIFIMKKIVTKLYPIKPRKIENGRRPELMTHDIVYQLEIDLQDWMNSLPLELKPGVEPSSQYLKANRLLHISYLHVKIILYRPFIHYLSSDHVNRPKSSNDLKCIEKAKNCINVARIVVKLAEDMINKNMLSGSYWFSIYTIFFSVACLVYYVHFAPPVTSSGNFDPEYIAIKKDAESGKRVLDILKDSSMAARRTYNILNALFEELNRKTANASISHEPPNSHFLTPQVGKSQFERDNHKKDQMAIPLPPQNMRPPEYVQQPFNGYSKMENSEINNIVNGVNFIDGVSTGINLNLPSNSEVEDVPSSISPPDQNSKYKYVPGPMDQLDMKIFGRFLPPYMLNSNQQSTDNTPEPEPYPEQYQEPENEPQNGTIFGSIPSGLSTVSQSQQNSKGFTGLPPDYQGPPKRYDFEDMFYNDWSAGPPNDFNQKS
ncbi:hypothetical protein KL925_003778 [Ogataea polymorpha]|uniref:Zn(2)-C6 fungal-type domain-containing protein n=3 Tax=Ogataea TaxID=461281 RepID=A0A9P8NTE3_9ASCO|nr:transcriptional activator Mut3p [Ogataea angusta]ABO63963.1 transcriptional activator Mut3p [synthetic construct]KAG7900796.1 hypothetical protein KL935_002729 [Ogataea polymorpha]KAG7904889.1 hypothetical protein KL907_003105 [Ogataea polymorpha]KAG7916573.1 hypothetical protein KL927_003212 [Ogataea polymorpha]